MKLLALIFGSGPDIFDAKGNVVHKLPEERWKAWRDRFNGNPDLDWHRHQGTTRQINTPQTIKKK